MFCFLCFFLSSVFDKRNYTFKSGGSRHLKTGVGLLFEVALSLESMQRC